MVKVLVVDDQIIFRQGAASLIDAHPDFKVVGQAANGKEAVEFINIYPGTDVILMDYKMPDMDGLAATETIRHLNNHTQVIIFSMHWNEDFVKNAFLAGAISVLSKDSTPQEVLIAIEHANNGKYYLTSGGIKLLVNKIKQYANTGIDERIYVPTEKAGNFFTNQEKEILQMIIDGNTSVEIAGRLGISRRTVEIYKTNMLNKTHTKSIANLVAFTISEGLIRMLDA